MALSTLAFVAAAVLIIVTPGPDSLLVLRNAICGGSAAGWVTGAGIITGLFVWAAAAALGLTVLLATSRLGYDALRVAGAAYLVWLGLRALLSNRDDEVETSCDRRRGYLTGLLTNLLNPKIGVFFVAFLPGFVPSGAPLGATSLLFGAVFVLLTALWFAVLVRLAAGGAGWLRRPLVRRRIRQASGVLFVGFGLRLASQVP